MYTLCQMSVRVPCSCNKLRADCGPRVACHICRRFAHSPSLYCLNKTCTGCMGLMSRLASHSKCNIMSPDIWVLTKYLSIKKPPTISLLILWYRRRDSLQHRFLCMAIRVLLSKGLYNLFNRCIIATKYNSLICKQYIVAIILICSISLSWSL